MADLRAVPWWARPLWVAEQLEVAVNEGLAGRARRTWARLAPPRRAAALWRREKDDFLNSRYTLGYTFAAVAWTLTMVYAALLVPGAGSVAFLAWAALSVMMAWFHQRDKKRLQPGQPLRASALDRRVLIVTGPATYVVTIYMLIHDLIALVSGNVAPGFCVGTLLCLTILVFPWQAIRSAMQEAAAPVK